MTTNEVKPGTRCQCPDAYNGCTSRGVNSHHDFTADCQRHAVRLVTVLDYPQGPSGYVIGTDVPMCDACAEYREKGGAS